MRAQERQRRKGNNRRPDRRPYPISQDVADAKLDPMAGGREQGEQRDDRNRNGGPDRDARQSDRSDKGHAQSKVAQPINATSSVSRRCMPAPLVSDRRGSSTDPYDDDEGEDL